MQKHFLKIYSTFSKTKMSLKFAANISMQFKEKVNLEERFQAAKDAGFKAVECPFAYGVSSEILAVNLEKSGVEQVLLNSYPGNAEKKEAGLAAVPGQESRFKESLELSIKYCKALKCKRLHIMAGKIPEHKEEERAALLQKMEETFVLNLKFASPLLQKEGILALIEPINTTISVPGYFMNNLELAERVIKKVHHENLKLQFDFFHIQIVHGNLTKNYEKYLPLIGYIQISQPPHRGEPDSPGEIDYDYIYSLIEKSGYDGWIGAEYNPTASTEECLKWFKKFKM